MSRAAMQVSSVLRMMSCLIAGVSLSYSPVVIAQGQVVSQPRVSAAIDESRLVTLAGNTHSFARAQFDLGPASTSGRMLLLFKRSPEQESTLQQLLHDQQDPTSPQYHKWLTPDEFGQRFGIADADLQTVSGYLQDKGFSIGKLSRGRMSLEISGSSEQIATAFHTEIHEYNVAGSHYFANNRDPQVPEALAPVVAGFASLSNYRTPTSVTPRQAVFDPDSRTLKPMFTPSGANGFTGYGVSPGDLANIYDIPAQTKPSGTAPSIGVISDSNVNIARVTAYQSLFKLKASAPNVIVDGDDPGLTSDALTTTEELELIGAVAPYATVDLYTAATTDYDTGLDFATVRAVSDDIVNVIEFGFLNCESSLSVAGNSFVSALWEQAAAQGQTVISATGDAGAAACDTPGGSLGQEVSLSGPAVNGWASTPYNTAVGGTDFYYTTAAPIGNYWSTTNSGTPAFTSAKGVIPQQPWNDSDQAIDTLTATPAPLYAGGGGSSSLGNNGASGYAVPSWQTVALNGKATTRAIPDLSLFAGDSLNKSFYLVCFASTDCANGTSSTFTTVGGTAGAASVFAGIVAQIVQSYSAQGNINPELYSLAATSTSTSWGSTTSVFYDVTNGSNYVSCAAVCTNGQSITVNGVTSTYIGNPAATGYDLASGLGTINATNFIKSWPNINSETAPGTVTLGVYSAYPGSPLSSGATITHGATTYFSATVAAAGGKGVPTGDVAVVSTDIQEGNKAVDRITLASGSGVDTSGVQLPGGTYSLSAYYAGSTSYAPASSSSFTITVNPEPSAIVIMSASGQPVTSTNYVTNLNFSLLSSPTVSYGTPIRITVEPFGIDETNSIGIPSGYITVLDNGSALTKIPLNSEGSATFSSNSLAVGSHSFTFSYAGDASFSASTSLAASTGAPVYNNFTQTNQTAINFTVSNVATTTALSATSDDLGASGGTSTLTAVVSSASAANTGSAPTGQVDFQFVNGNGGVSNTYVNVTPAYDSNGNLVSTATLTINAAGTYTAIFNATGNYLNSTGNSLPIADNLCDLVCFSTNSTTTVTVAGGGTTFDSDANLVFNVQVVAYVPDTRFFPTTDVTGTIIFYANGVQIGQGVTVNSANGTATFTVPKTGNYMDVPSGSVTFTAYYTGGIANPGAFEYTAGPSDGTVQLTIVGNSQGNPNPPNLSGDYTIQALQTAQVMPAGTAGSLAFPLQLSATDSFAQNFSSSSIALTCASSTPGLTCTLSPTSVSLASGFASVTATVKPAANYTVALNQSLPAATRWWMTGAGVAMGFVFLLGIPARRRGWQAMLSLFFLCFVAIGLNGCAGNSLAASNASEGTNVAKTGVTPTSVLPGTGGTSLPSPGLGTKNSSGITPDGLSTLAAGTYPITVTGTVTLNSVVVTHNAVFNVVVQ
jgi:hypothetical protein